MARESTVSLFFAGFLAIFSDLAGFWLDFLGQARLLKIFDHLGQARLLARFDGGKIFDHLGQVSEPKCRSQMKIFDHLGQARAGLKRA